MIFSSICSIQCRFVLTWARCFHDAGERSERVFECFRLLHNELGTLWYQTPLPALQFKCNRSLASFLSVFASTRMSST